METVNHIEVKQQVRQFYDEVGWQEIGEGVYQNARYEDLRPVSREYIHNCHMRVIQHLNPSGNYFLDAGSGPIQYPEYLAYSKGYQIRVCADISIVALKEARQRIGDREEGGEGLFVVADVAHLPFKQDVFDGVISLHTIHHLPMNEHRQAYLELYRVLSPSNLAVVVNGWQDSPIMRLFVKPMKWKNRTRKKIRHKLSEMRNRQTNSHSNTHKDHKKGTFVSKHDAEWLKREVGSLMDVKIFVWRSVSVRFLREYIHPKLGGKWILRQLFKLEERFPHFFGEKGQYPLIVIKKAKIEL